LVVEATAEEVKKFGVAPQTPVAMAASPDWNRVKNHVMPFFPDGMVYNCDRQPVSAVSAMTVTSSIDSQNIIVIEGFFLK
jgi:hypothetical protein